MALNQETRLHRSASDRRSLFHDHPLFEKLDPELIDRLCSYAHTRKVKKGTAIFARGDPGNSLFAVFAGAVKISIRSPDGKDAIFNVVGAGGIFGEIALLDGRERTADATAIADCELLVIDRREFLPLVHRHPEMAVRIIEVLCGRVRNTSEQVEHVMFLNLASRLARTLLSLADNIKPSPQGRKVTITQREIGQIIGMSRESTNKQLRIWEQQNLVRLERGGIVVLAPDALARIASAQIDD